jgi:purine-binding chemotaxis protein CheW
VSEARDEQRILRERARALALPAPTLGLGETEAQLLVFTRGEARYALDVKFVRELLPLPDYAELPFSPPACLGLLALRGDLLALFDLAALHSATEQPAAPSLMLLCGEPSRELALAVDEALDLVSVGPIRRPPEDQDGPVVGFDERGFLVLDGEALLSDPRLTIDPQLAENAP